MVARWRWPDFKIVCVWPFGLEGLWLRYTTLQNLIPSFPWIAPGMRAWGRNPRGRDQILPSGNLAEIQEEEEEDDSDFDFIPLPDPDLDCDECFDDGEIPDDEVRELEIEGAAALDVDELRRKMMEAKLE